VHSRKSIPWSSRRRPPRRPPTPPAPRLTSSFQDISQRLVRVAAGWLAVWTHFVHQFSFQRLSLRMRPVTAESYDGQAYRQGSTVSVWRLTETPTHHPKNPVNSEQFNHPTQQPAGSGCNRSMQAGQGQLGVVRPRRRAAITTQVAT
jgi:hypothetical protein